MQSDREHCQKKRKERYNALLKHCTHFRGSLRELLYYEQKTSCQLRQHDKKCIVSTATLYTQKGYYFSPNSSDFMDLRKVKSAVLIKDTTLQKQNRLPTNTKNTPYYFNHKYKRRILNKVCEKLKEYYLSIHTNYYKLNTLQPR